MKKIMIILLLTAGFAIKASQGNQDKQKFENDVISGLQAIDAQKSSDFIETLTIQDYEDHKEFFGEMLFLAARNGKFSRIEALLDRGVPYNVKHNTYSIFSTIVESNNGESLPILRKFLEGGASPDEKYMGRSLLDCAEESNWVSAALLREFADARKERESSYNTPVYTPAGAGSVEQESDTFDSSDESSDYEQGTDVELGSYGSPVRDKSSYAKIQSFIAKNKFAVSGGILATAALVAYGYFKKKKAANGEKNNNK